MSKHKNKNCYPKYNKLGELISYRFYYSEKDIYTGKVKQYTKTWKVPNGLTNKEIEFERKKVEFEFYKECEKKSLGTNIQDNNITFGEFSKQWLERILKRNEDSYSYYVQAENSLKVINQYFGNYLLKQISPLMIQKFYDYLCDRTYIKETVTVKKSIEELITRNNLNKTQTAEDCGINRLTLRIASKIGNQVSLETARSISRYFNVPLTQYFNVEKKEVKYSKATNSGIRTILVVILGEAKRQQLIEHNYASKDYTRAITGTTKQKEIFDEEESKEFVRAVLNETNLKRKTIFALLIFLGSRFTIESVISSRGTYRLDTWIRAFKAMGREPYKLLFGFGNGSSLAVIGGRWVAHNFVIQLLLELGIVGSCLFYAFLWRWCRRLARYDSMCLSVVLGCMAISLTLSVNKVYYFWVILILSIVCSKAKESPKKENQLT